MASQAVGMIGLGSLGGAMARRLVGLGWVVHGYDADSARLSAAVAAGVEAAASPAAVGAACDRVILSLPDSDAVEAVCLGETGLIHAARAQLLVLDTTSGYPHADAAWSRARSPARAYACSTRPSGAGWRCQRCRAGAADVHRRWIGHGSCRCHGRCWTPWASTSFTSGRWAPGRSSSWSTTPARRSRPLPRWKVCWWPPGTVWTCGRTLR